MSRIAGNRFISFHYVKYHVDTIARSETRSDRQVIWLDLDIRWTKPGRKGVIRSVCAITGVHFLVFDSKVRDKIKPLG